MTGGLLAGAARPIERARRALLIDAAKGVLAGARAAAFEEANAAGLSLAEIGQRVGIGRAKVSEARSRSTGRRPGLLATAADVLGKHAAWRHQASERRTHPRSSRPKTGLDRSPGHLL